MHNINKGIYTPQGPVYAGHGNMADANKAFQQFKDQQQSPPDHESQVAEQVSRLKRVVERLDLSTRTIIEKIEPILRPFPDVDQNSPVPPEPTVCGLASELRDIVGQLERSVTYLNYHTDRIEL